LTIHLFKENQSWSCEGSFFTDCLP